MAGADDRRYVPDDVEVPGVVVEVMTKIHDPVIKTWFVVPVFCVILTLAVACVVRRVRGHRKHVKIIKPHVPGKTD